MAWVTLRAESKTDSAAKPTKAKPFAQVEWRGSGSKGQLAIQVDDLATLMTRPRLHPPRLTTVLRAAKPVILADVASAFF